MRRRSVLAAASLALAGCGDPLRTVNYKYRFKFVAVVDGEERVGESVIRVRWRDPANVMSRIGGQFEVTLWAEAPIMDMGADRGLLFAALRGASGGPLYPAYVLPGLALGFLNRTTSEERLEALREMPSVEDEIVVPREQWPLFVWFRDPMIPATAEEVTPDTMAAVFGDGAALMRVTMQVTSAPVTRRITRVLPWVPSLATNLAGERRRRARGPLAGRLGGLEFRMWNLTF